MYEYINKDVYNKIPANERHFIKLSQEAAYAAVKMLEEAHIAHSATISEYRSVITVYKADSENAEKIAENAAKAYPTQKSVIGNTEYKFIRDKKYIDTDAETAMKIAAILSGNANNRFSGIIKGNKATITVSGEKNAAAVRAMVDNIKNLDLLEALRAQGFERVADTNGFVNIRNIQTDEVCGFNSMSAVREMFYSPENDFFHPLSHRIAYREHPQTGEYYYYILKYNPADRNTAYVLRDYENKPYLFQSVDEAISFVQSSGIKITNIDEEIANWRELEREREDTAIFESNKRLIEQFPERNGDYIDLVRYNKDSDTFSWIYFNPQGDNGNGEFIDKTITKDDIFAAYSERISAETEEQGRGNFIAYLNRHCRENVIDIHSGYFSDYADDYINYASRNYSYYFGISENSTAAASVDDFISIFELNTEEVVRDKEAHAEPQEITPNSAQIELEKAAAIKEEFLNTIEIDKYSEPENGKTKIIGTKTYGEVFSELEAHLNKMGLIPNEYFKLSFDAKEDEPIPDNWIRFNCNTNFGSSEGIYLDIDIVTEDNTVRFITGKTLGENVEDFLKMSRIGAECSMLLNGNGAVIRHSREKSQEINSKIEMSVSNGDSAKAEEIITEVETSFPNGDSAQADELNTGTDTATMLISKIPELNTDTAVKIINAFEKATLDEWQDNNAKINRIKKAIYDIVGSENLTERAFALISKFVYDFDTDKLNFSFGENGVNEWFTESKLLGDIVAENPKMSFALANAVIEYLDKKQHTEREIEGLNAGWYKKTDFKIEAVIDGETYTYSGRFDIGDGLNMGGGSLIDHIKQINEIILTSDRYPYNEQENKNKAKSTLDVLVPFLIKNSELTADEKRILADFKFKNPVEYSSVRDFKEKTDKMFKGINGFSADEIENLAVEYVRGIFEQNGIDAYVVAGAVTGSRSRGLEGENSDIDIVFEIQSDLKEDALFNILNENPYDFDGIKVDINPIRAEETGTLENYLPEAEKYLEEKAQKRTADIQNSAYRQAVDFINSYAEDEFGEKADFSDTSRIDLAYSHNDESNMIVDVYADLDNFRIVKELDGKIASEQKFNSLEEMNKILAVLDFNELVALTDEQGEIKQSDEKEYANNTNVSETLNVGDYIGYMGKMWELTQTGFTLLFKNVDENDREQEFSYIGGADSFIKSHYDTIDIIPKAVINYRNDTFAFEKDVEEKGAQNMPDSIIFSFVNGNINWRSESSDLNNFIRENDRVSFALANAVLEYLNEKHNIESEYPELDIEGYDKTDFNISCIIDGEKFSYNGEYDIGSNGGDLITHIKGYNEYLINNKPSWITDEQLAEKQHLIDVLIPFLEKHSELTAEEKQILEKYKKDNPIRGITTEKAEEKETENGKSEKIIILAEDKAYSFSEIKFETGEEYIVPGVITDDNLSQTSAYKEILERYSDNDNIESLDDMIRVNIVNYRYGSGDETVPNTEETAYIINNYNDVVNNSVQTGQTEFFMQFWRNIEDVLNELDDKTAEQHRTNPTRSDKFAEKTCIFPADYNSDYPDYYSAVTELKIGGEWLGTEEAVKKMNAQGNTDPAQIEALRVRTVSFDGVMRNEELNPEEFYIILDRTKNNQDMLKEAAKLYDSKHGNIIPVYKKLIKEADAAGERDIYYENRKENVSCGRSLDYSVSRNSDTFSFDSDKAITDLLDTYSVERIALVIADRVSKSGEWDKRFSPQNVEWAKKVTAEYPPEMLEKFFGVTLNSHSVLINDIADKLRTQYDKYHEIQNKKETEVGKEQSVIETENVSVSYDISDVNNSLPIQDEELTEIQQKTVEIAKKYEKLPIQDKINIIAQAFDCTTGKIVTSPCRGKWRGTSDISIMFDNGKSLYIGNRITPKAKTVKVQNECVNAALTQYNPEIIKITKETALAALRKRATKDNEIAAEKGLKPYTLLNVEFNNGADESNGGYIGWYYITLAVDGKIHAHIDTNLNYDILNGKVGETSTNKGYYSAGTLKDSDVDYVFNNVGFSSTSELYSLTITNEVRERAEKTLNELTRLQNSTYLGNSESDRTEEKAEHTDEPITSSDNSNAQMENTAAGENSPVGNILPKINDTVENEDGFFTVADIKGDYATLIEADTLFAEQKIVSLTDLYGGKFTVIESAETVSVVEQSISESAENTEKQSAKSENYIIKNENFGDMGGAKSRYNANIAAIRLLKSIEAESRTATADEQNILAGYTGWGAIPQVFDNLNDKWKKEYSELKELLTAEEYEAARHSTMNAHYTSPTVISAIYDGLKKIGFESGKILEPSMGIGNFFGMLPEEMKDSKLYGVELDSITGRIAKQLYPNADIQIKGYENTNFLDNSFDVAVSNVPFGDYKVNDKKYNDNNFNIHDYFFAKTLDKVRPGGIIAFVTSKGTLDKENDDIRRYIAQRAEFLGAVRLPNNAFKATAGTEVTSDIIFLQKREKLIEVNPPEIEWLKKAEISDGLSVNNYFVQHPEMVLGKIVAGNKLYGTQSNETTCEPIIGADLKTQLAEAIQNIKGRYEAAEIETPIEDAKIIPAPDNSRKFSFCEFNGNIYYREAGDTMEKINVSKDIFNRAMGMIELRDNVHELLNLQLDNSDKSLDTKISESRTRLNKSYDEFVKKYGNISDRKNAKAFKGDNGYKLLSALELKDEKGKVVGKADIFNKNTIKPKIIASRVETAEEALILSVSEKGKVDFDFMTELCGMDKDRLISALDGQIYKLPQETEKYVTADEYLTGNIRKKMEDITECYDPQAYEKNYKALQAAMPPRVEAKDIYVKLGSHWVDPKYIRQFILEKFKPDARTFNELKVTYSKAAGAWKVEGASTSAKTNHTAINTFGTKRKNAYEIVEGILNNSDLVVKDRKLDEYGNFVRDKNGNYVLIPNEEETKAVRRCAKIIQSEFADWIFKDPERREDLVQTYNSIFNSFRYREYDGSHLNFVGMNTEITLKEHQKNAIARGLYGGNTLLAHAVGAGKTFEMIAIAMEGKRLGLHNKSLFAVPNALTEQIGNDFRKLYPNANILVATKKDFEKENRQQLLANIAANDWDAVIVGHSQFDRMGLSPERESEYIHSEVKKLRHELELIRAENPDDKKSFSVKQIEKTITSYEDRLKKLDDKQAKDDFIDFEQLGFDKIFVDESHMYKNLATATKMRNVAGLGSRGSARAFNLLMKAKYLDTLTGGKGCVFASGTPNATPSQLLQTA